MSALRIAVVGAGHMGRAHARKVRSSRARTAACTLAGVAIVDAARAASLGGRARRRLARAERARALRARRRRDRRGADARALRGGARRARGRAARAGREADRGHARGGRGAGGAGARARDRVLQVGHQEWFNAAMRVVRERIDRPRFAEIHRLGPFPERGTDVDVVRDLMIHDIEILQQLLGAEPERVDAVGVPVLTDHVDIANARLALRGSVRRESHREPRLRDADAQAAALPARRLLLDRLPRAARHVVPPAALGGRRAPHRGGGAEDRPRGRAARAARGVRRRRAAAARPRPARSAGSAARRRWRRCAPRCA